MPQLTAGETVCGRWFARRVCSRPSRHCGPSSPVRMYPSGSPPSVRLSLSRECLRLEDFTPLRGLAWSWERRSW